MSNIPSAATYIQLEGARFRSAVSESLVQAVGGSNNYLLDTTTTQGASITDTRNRAIERTQGAATDYTDSSFIGVVDRVIHAPPTNHYATVTFLWLATAGAASGQIRLIRVSDSTQVMSRTDSSNPAGTEFMFTMTIPIGYRLEVRYTQLGFSAASTLLRVIAIDEKPINTV